MGLVLTTGDSKPPFDVALKTNGIMLEEVRFLNLIRKLELCLIFGFFVICRIIDSTIIEVC